MPKPQLAILHYSTPPTIGGVESTIRDHALLFADHGYPVRLVTGSGESFDPRVPVTVIPEIHSRAPRVEAVQRELAGGVVSPAFQTLAADLYTALVPALADVDLLIVHNALTLHKNLALTVALHRLVAAGRIRVIAWSHDFAWTDPVYANELHPGMPWQLLREPWAGVRHVVVSEARRAELAALLQVNAQTIAVVPPGLDAGAFLQLGATAARWAEQFHLYAAAPLLLLPARVTRRKNIELAIEVTSALRARGKTPVLLVMGPLGPHNPANRAYLEELRARRAAHGLDDAVIFLQEHGAVDDVTRRDLYFLADALFFPSEREGFGIPILEAGLARLPIFCADIPPFRESAQAYANYFSLDAAPAEIAAQLSAVLDADPQYQLKQRVAHTYHWEQIFVQRIEPLVV